MAVISVITPTFNRAKFLKEAIASVLAQTHRELELIIIDDGSEDATHTVVEPFLADRRVRYFYQNNQGQAAARNHGLSRSGGEYIAFLDSDDIWVADKLERQLKVFREYPEVDIVHGDEALIDEQSVVTSRENMKRYSGQITRYLLADNSVSITTALVRRRCFDEMGGFDAAIPVADDYELWLRFSARFRYHYLPGILAFYRVMPDQISSDKRRRFKSNELIINSFLSRYSEVLSPQDLRWGLSRFYCRKARYFATTGDRMEAFGAIYRAFLYSPFDSVIWRSLYRVLVTKR